MPSQFEYSGVDASGQPISGLFEGESPMEVVLKLRDAGVKVYSIKKKFLGGAGFRTPSGKIRPSELIVFNSQLASLLKTKLPLSESVRHLAREVGSSRLKAILDEVTGQLDAGQSLSESLASRRDRFPPLYVSMVEAGEKSGNLAEVLFHVSEHFRSIEDFRAKCLRVMIYPAIVTVLAMAVLVFLIKLMVPPYVELYSGFYTEFPFPLKILIAVGQFLRPNMFWAIGLPIALAGIVAAILLARNSPGFRTFVGRVILQVPLFGNTVRDAALVRNFATLAILLRSGVPLDESLNIVKNLVSNGPIKSAFEVAADMVSEGAPFSQALVVQSTFPLEIAWVVRSGETKGDLTEALDKAKQMCQERFESSSKMIVSILEPALLIVMGVVVVSIAISLFYPLYALSKYLGP